VLQFPRGMIGEEAEETSSVADEVAGEGSENGESGVAAEVVQDQGLGKDGSEGKEKKSPIFETRLERALDYKEKGNGHFKNEKWEEALNMYEMGLYHSEFDEMQYNFELMDDHRAQVNSTRIPLLLNAAACLLKLKRPKEAIEKCNEVLKVDSENTKALFRRGQGYQLQNNFEKARDDLVKAAKAAPQDRAVRIALNAVVEELRKENEAGKKLWKGKIEAAAAREAKREEKGKADMLRELGEPTHGIDNRGMCQRFFDAILAQIFSSNETSTQKKQE